MSDLQTTFNPTDYSLQECQFLIDHLGEAPFLAVKAIKAAPLPDPPRDPKTGKLADKNPVYYPDGVIPASVVPALQRVYELEAERAHEGRAWVGIDALKAALQVYITQSQKWERDKSRRGAPRFPSMHSFDLKNKPHKGGPGSDSGRVHTYFDAEGERKSLLVDLFGTSGEAWAPEWAATRRGTDLPKAKTGLRVDAINHRYECLVCGHTENFKEESRSSFNAARARMGKHLTTAKDEVSAHREVYTVEF